LNVYAPQDTQGNLHDVISELSHLSNKTSERSKRKKLWTWTSYRNIGYTLIYNQKLFYTRQGVSYEFLDAENNVTIQILLTCQIFEIMEI